jgi:hypothetical protein
MPEPLRHSDECQSIFMTSTYDKRCPRCSKIWIVIQLKRKNTSNGATILEALSANQQASNIANKYQLKPVELRDRLYESPTNDIVITRYGEVKKKTRRGKGWKHQDVVEDYL